jgi:parallel beta-helix repeat protein
MPKIRLVAIILLVLTLALAPNYQNIISVGETRQLMPMSFVSGNATSSLDNFTIIVLPDTQGYSETYPWIFDNQTQWIADNVNSMNIVFVTQLGDLVNIPYNISEWENANQSMSKLDGKVPWSVLLGNHDSYNDSRTNFNRFFGVDRFKGESWYGGAYNISDNSNNYQLFSVSGNGYLILNLQYDPSDDVLRWASHTIDSYPERKVIVSTHDYLMGLYRLGQRSYIGERMWHGLIKQHAEQVFLVLCGHAGAEDFIADNVDGNTVYQVLSDYQPDSYIESGWLRILEFCPNQQKIYVKTYSPILNTYKNGSESEFTLDYKTSIRSPLTACPEKDNTIYIRANGTIEPTTAPIARKGNVYTFEHDIFSTLVVEKDDAFIDGSGFALIGTGATDFRHFYERNPHEPYDDERDKLMFIMPDDNFTGIYGRANNLTVTNATILNFACGIEIEYGSNNCIFNNQILNNYQGIWIHYSSNNAIYNNTIANNYQGLTLVTSHDIIQNNIISNNTEYGIHLSWSFNTVLKNSLMNNGNDIWVLSSYNNIYDNDILSVTPIPASPYSKDGAISQFVIPVIAILAVVVISAMLYIRHQKTIKLSK